MLLLLTIGLVLVGAVALVIGFVSSSQLPIFISIACSIAAGIVLAVFSRMSRRAAAPATAGSGPAPLVEPTTASPDLDEAAEAGDLVRTQAVPVVGDTFPIEDYDDLLVSEILPLLPELDLDELDLVREREESGKKRSSILKRIDQLAEELEGEEAPAVPAAVGAVEEVEVDDELEDEDEGEREDAGLGIANYDSLKVPQILAQLDDLTDEQLDEIAEYEERHANRRAIIDAIDNMFEEGPVEAAPVKAAAKAPAKKVVAKKSAVRSTAKKAAPVKSASSSTRATAKKAGAAKKAAARSAAPAKKTAAKKAAAKKAPAKSAVKKSAAKKASPAKKAAKRR